MNIINYPSQEKLNQKHADVPPDYYEKGIKENKFQRFWHQKRFNEVLRLIPRGKQISRYLDVGCDGGLLMSRVVAELGKTEAHGVDISEESIAYAKGKYPEFKLQVADCHHLPFPEGYFDLVTCFEVLEHVPGPVRALAEMKRCLKKEGELIILIPSESLLFEIIWFFWTRFGRGRAWHETHIKHLRPEDLEPMLQNMGFEIEKAKESHWGMLKIVKAKLMDKNL